MRKKQSISKITEYKALEEQLTEQLKQLDTLRNDKELGEGLSSRKNYGH